MVRLSVLVLCLASSLAFGQGGPSRTYGRAEGLLNLNPQCLLQDREGYLSWVGTQNGLFRYDGGRFLAFVEPPKASPVPSASTPSINRPTE